MKTNIRIIVQGDGETAANFAKRLEGICAELGDDINGGRPMISFMTTDTQGRQTATIQFITEDEQESLKKD